MLFKSLLALVPVVAAIETHGGIDFDLRHSQDGAVETKPIKTFYETTAAKQATDRLIKRIHQKGYKTACLNKYVTSDPAFLYDLKDCLVAEDPEVFLDLLSKDIAEADAFWEKVVAESTKPRSEWIVSRSYVRAYFDGELTAAQFAAWQALPNSDTGYLRGNAEHYGKSTENLSLTAQRAHIFEGWGGVLSKLGTKIANFTVPDFELRQFGTDDYPIEWAIDPRFGVLQRAGQKTLNSGTVWGVLHIGARDFTAEEGTTGKSGLEIYGAVWYPPWDKSSKKNQKEFAENFLKDEDWQILSEVVNFSLQAHKDCQDPKLCVIPGQ